MILVAIIRQNMGVRSMPDKLLKQRIAELNANNSAPPAVSDDKEKRTYSIEEIQQILDISRSTAYLLIKRKLFKSVKVGKQIRISKKSFDEWLDTF